jgi:hypothetical protein
MKIQEFHGSFILQGEMRSASLWSFFPSSKKNLALKWLIFWRNIMRRGLFFAAMFCHIVLFADWGPPITVFTQTDTSAGTPAVGIDSSGNAIIGYSWIYFMDSEIGAAQLINGTLTNTVAFPVDTFSAGPAGSLNIAVNPSGNATLIWTEYNAISSTDLIRANSFLNGTWSSPISLTDPSVENISTATFPGITIDNSNDSIGIWVPQNNGSGNYSINYDLYSSGFWEGENDLYSPSGEFIPASYLSGSSSGEAFALWPNTGSGDLQGAYFNGTNWTTYTSISNDLNLTACIPPVAVSMNSSNDALILWDTQMTGAIESVLFSAGMFGMEQQVYLPSGSEVVQSVAVALDDAGDGAAVWITGNTAMPPVFSLYFSSYISGNWGLPIVLDQLAGDVVNLSFPNIEVDGDGNAVIAWQRTNEDFTTGVMVSYMAKGAIGAPTPVLLSTDTTDGQAPYLAVNSSGKAIVCWQNGSNPGNSIQVSINYFSADLMPPLNLSGKYVKNRFATQIDRVNILNWDASLDPTVVKYFVFRDGVQIGVVLASSPLTYQDHKRSSKTVLYEVTAVNESNSQSSPISVSIP